MRLIIISILVFLLGLATFLAFTTNLFSQSTKGKNWPADLDYYKSTLEHKHIDLYNKISKDDFNKEIQRIKAGIDEKTDFEIVIDLMRLTRKVGDGHTAVSLKNRELHVFPIEVYHIGGKWRVVRVGKDYKGLLGKELMKIDGKGIEEIAHEVSEVAQHVENKQSEIIRTGQQLHTAELLYGLQIINNEFKARFTFQNESGEIEEVLLYALNTKNYNNLDFESINIQVPEISTPKYPKHDLLWFSPIEGTKGIYIKMGAYPSPEDMEAFGKKVLNFINDNAIEKMAIDLRNNGGGDFFVGLALANHLNLADYVDWKSGVYVLTDKVTFSAASCNATQFRQILNAKIVGEPTGSNPVGYQDMGEFELPHSNLTITFSKRLFRLQQDRTEGVQPNVFIPYDWNDFSNGKDNMLQWVINDMKRKNER